MMAGGLGGRRIHNVVQTALLVAGMGAILGMVGWLVGGAIGSVSAIVLGLAGVTFGPRLSPYWLLRFYRARPLGPQEAPVLFQLVQELAHRAGLRKAPGLYVVPSELPNAFSVGERDNGAIAVTSGLVGGMTFREAAGILAHELSHLQHNDVRVMSLADTVSRLTSLLALFGQILVLFNLPFVVSGHAVVSWWLVGLLISAPYLSALLQLAVSRSREFDADIGAVSITGDPKGLASALAKLEESRRGIWRKLLLPGRPEVQPSVLRTHPHTEERIRRLMSLDQG